MIKSDEENRFAALRERAEAALRSVDLRAQTEALAALSPGEVKRLIHDIWVYRVELEMQNDEMRRAQIELVASRDRYLALFDFAPVGYFVIDEAGMIQEVNLRGAGLLGQERGTLVGTLLVRSFRSEDRDRFHIYHRKLINGHESAGMTATLTHRDGTASRMRVVGSLVKGAPGMCRLAVIDLDSPADDTTTGGSTL